MDDFEAALLSGYCYCATTDRQEVGPKGYSLMQLSVPWDSDKTMSIRLVDVSSFSPNLSLNIIVDELFKEEDGGGQKIEPHNLNSGFPDVSMMKVKNGVASHNPILGGVLYDERNFQHRMIYQKQIDLRPGHTVILVTQNVSEEKSHISINVTWVESEDVFR